MASEKRGLGRGIDTLFRNSSVSQEVKQSSEEITKLTISALIPCPSQPRKIFEDRPLEELAESIRNQGIVQPILVRPILDNPGKYEIVAGERRYRAAKIVGLTEVPVCVRSLSDTDALAVALVENLQREDLNPIEEAQAMQALRENLGESQESLAARLGKSRSAVANTLRLLQLPDNMQRALSGNTFTAGHARAVLSIQDDENAQRQLFDAILDKQLTVRDAENAAQHHKRNGTLPDAVTGTTMEESSQRRDTGTRAPKTELVRDIQRLLRVTVHPKVTVSGSGDMGRVTIPYESADSLAELLRRLGGTDDDADMFANVSVQTVHTDTIDTDATIDADTDAQTLLCSPASPATDDAEILWVCTSEPVLADAEKKTASVEGLFNENLDNAQLLDDEKN